MIEVNASLVSKLRNVIREEIACLPSRTSRIWLTTRQADELLAVLDDAEMIYSGRERDAS